MYPLVGNFNIAIENGPFIDGLPIYRWFIESYGIYIYTVMAMNSYTGPGKRLQKTMENHNFLWVNSLFLWPFSTVSLPEGKWKIMELYPLVI
jgi:hypothetical protein